MENGYAGGIDTNSLLLARGVGGYGYGGFGGGYGAGGGILTAEAMANGTATKEAIDCGIRQFDAGLNRVSDQAEESRRSAQFTTLVDTANSNSNRLSDRMSTTTLQDAINDGNVRVENVRQFADLQKSMADCCCDTQKAIADAAKEAAACCCDSKLQACKDHAALSALVIQENSATRELIRGDALAAANAKIVQLETINALSHRHHG